MATKVTSIAVAWLLFASCSAADSPTTKAIQAVLEEQTAAQVSAYTQAIAGQVEAARKAEERLKALVVEFANTPGEAEAIKARNAAVTQREQLEAVQKAAAGPMVNLAEVQLLVKKLKEENGNYKKADDKRRDELSAMRAELSKAESTGRKLQSEVDGLTRKLAEHEKPKVKPVPAHLVDAFAGKSLRWNWVDLRDCKHDNKTWYEAKAFLKQDAKDHSWRHYPMNDKNPTPQYDAHFELRGISPYSNDLVEIELTYKNGSKGIFLWNVPTDVIFPLTNIPFCAALDPTFHTHGPIPVQK
jgi:hypothetical protein